MHRVQKHLMKEVTFVAHASFGTNSKWRYILYVAFNFRCCQFWIQPSLQQGDWHTGSFCKIAILHLKRAQRTCQWCALSWCMAQTQLEVITGSHSPHFQAVATGSGGWLPVRVIRASWHHVYSREDPNVGSEGARTPFERGGCHAYDPETQMHGGSFVNQDLPPQQKWSSIDNC